jgi:sulfur transfer complex TusBCD TusB component (DsrH family)
MKTLQVLECAYRATYEEQDDTVLWITQAMRNAGADLAVLLRANAVNYAVAAQTADPLTIGTWKQTQPPAIAADVAGLLRKDVAVYALKDDLDERGIDEGRLLPGVARIRHVELAGLFERYDRVWYW